MNIFIILYLFVIIAALLLILYLISKKEKFSNSLPFEMRCSVNRAVQVTQELPVLYYYFDSVNCGPSNDFVNKILTQNIKDKFLYNRPIDLIGYDKNQPQLFPYTDKISLTPSIIIEYTYIIDDTIKNKILALEDKSEGIHVENVNEDKYLIIINNLNKFIPDDESDTAESKQSAFTTFINSMIITS